MIATLDADKSTTQVSVGGTKTYALIDTGANISVVNKKFLDKTLYSKTSLRPSSIRSVIAVNGNHVRVLGKLDMSITIGNNRKCTTTVYVLPELHHSLILGVDFLKETKAKLNFANSTLEIIENDTATTLSQLNINEVTARVRKAITIPKFSETLITLILSNNNVRNMILCK